MFTRIRREDGAATLEFGMVLPILLLLAAMTFPLLKAGYEYIVFSRAVAHGVRYASRADENARRTADGALTRRPTTSEVDAYIREAVGATLAENLVGNVEVTPEPFHALPGQEIQVQAKYRISFGVLDNIANSVSGLFTGGGAYLPDSKEVTVSARGREE